jgi:hypothetical protein
MQKTMMGWPAPRKKLIEFGWNSPTPTYLRDNLPSLEKSGFDGVTIKLSDEAGGGYIFDLKKGAAVSQEARVRDAALLRALPPRRKLTHNFLVVHGTSTLDWFSDTDWKKAEEQLRWCARVAHEAGLVGLVWDAEPYNGFPCWSYDRQPHRATRSFADYYQQVRKRGTQFIQCVQKEFPKLTILSLRQLSDFQTGSPFSASLLPARDVATLQKRLSGAWWGLHAAFTNGILDAIAPGVTFVDGNEDAYFYTSALEFERIVRVLKGDAQVLVEPRNRARYATQYQVGHAVSVDYTLGNWANAIEAFPDYLRKQALELTPEQRVQWFEHNLYHALRTADEYVWVYAEDMNWWDGRKIPPGYREALASAQRKVESGDPPGFEIEGVLQAAREKIRQRGAA